MPGDYRPELTPLLSANGAVAIVTTRDADGLTHSIQRWRPDLESTEVILTGRGIETHAVSADGTTVVTQDDAGDLILTAAGQFRLPFDRRPWDCLPLLSQDGGSVVGCVNRTSVLIRDGQMQVEIGGLPPDAARSMPLAINRDGTAVGGVAYSWAEGTLEVHDVKPMLWTARMGTQLLALPQEFDNARVVAVSDDGKRAVLIATETNAANVKTSVVLRWTEPGEVEVVAMASEAVVNADTTVIVGTAGLLYRWTEDEGLTWPSDVTNGSIGFGRVRGLASDGGRIIGSARGGELPPPTPLMWDSKLGFVFPDSGVVAHDNQSWLASFASHSISENGEFILGSAHCDGKPLVVRLSIPR
jgi:hypothetical protein